MIIKNWIIEKEVKMTAERIEKLKEIGAPKIMIEVTEKMLKELKSGALKVGGDNELLNEEAINPEVKKGQGGSIYIHFENGINYFPKAKYGKYISRGEK